MNGKFIDKYFYYLSTEKKISNNTAIMYMKSIGTLICTAVKEGLLKHDPFSEKK